MTKTIETTAKGTEAAAAPERIAAEWIGLDWGTTNLRAYAMAGETCLAEARARKGMNTLATRDDFERALFDTVGAWLPEDPEARVRVVACGMVGARQGWREAPYLRAPTKPIGEPRAVPTSRPGILVEILPGISQDEPPEVMRGEETQIAGLLAAEPNFEGVVCLPGTHTKWVRVADGCIVAFRTAMTGEIFGLLSERSVLRHVMDEEWDEGIFAAAVAEAAADPAQAPLAFFRIRAQSLLHDTIPGESRARLSGLLIGAELAALGPFREAAAVRVVGNAVLAGHYAKALGALGQGAILHDGAAMTRAGLAAAWAGGAP
ncbi:2-dehydro-3-deoxygalactonokinase [Salinarimonas chemoclinalis]|uniref:2-dehydro-3-deoxygalactonokinase n=1 Tax=Salinarimonas chemoclinalis TaxID=3241599 RepID=UPI0035586265